jgi:hypothetical protein
LIANLQSGEIVPACPFERWCDEKLQGIYANKKQNAETDDGNNPKRPIPEAKIDWDDKRADHN